MMRIEREKKSKWLELNDKKIRIKRIEFNRFVVHCIAFNANQIECMHCEMRKRR